MATRPTITFTTSDTPLVIGTFSLTLFGNDTVWDDFVAYSEDSAASAEDKANAAAYSAYSLKVSVTSAAAGDVACIQDQGADMDALVAGNTLCIQTPGGGANLATQYRLTAAQTTSAVGDASTPWATANVSALDTATAGVDADFQFITLTDDDTTNYLSVSGAAFQLKEDAPTSGAYTRYEAGKYASGHTLTGGAWATVAAVELTGAASLAAGALALSAALSF